MTRIGPAVGLWGSALACLALAHQPWWTASWSDALGEGSAPLTGVAATSGLARALPLAALGGTLLAWWLGRVGRRVVAGVLLVVHTAGGVLGATNPQPGDGLVTEALGAARLVGTVELATTPWPWVYGAAAAVGLGSALWLAWRPQGGVGETVREDAVRDERAALADSANPWKAMDDGIDPTAAPGA